MRPEFTTEYTEYTERRPSTGMGADGSNTEGSEFAEERNREGHEGTRNGIVWRKACNAGLPSGNPLFIDAGLIGPDGIHES
jgi:hypothetical protein